MVGIVIVSHSARLAEGLLELIEQMVQGGAAVAVAGGIDDPENPIGTDALKVYEAIETVYDSDGVVVLLDLGSALLSAETALEFLSPEQQANVVLCPAPLVEGAMAAAVQASIGAGLEQVINEARGALAAKLDRLEPDGRPPAPETAPTPPAPVDQPAQQTTLVVPNPHGLHARPAAHFVKTAGQFKADIRVSRGDKTANAKSINQVATLGAQQGDTLLIQASGPDADAALRALTALAAANFGEAGDSSPTAPLAPAAAPAPPPTAPDEALTGIPASPGIAIGPVVHYRAVLPEVDIKHVADTAAEWARLQAAIAATLAELISLQAQAARRAGADEAAIFEAHQLILQDPDLMTVAQTHIAEFRLNAEAAWHKTIETTANTYRSLDSAYMRERAADVLDVGRQVLRQLGGETAGPLDFARPSILIAADLSPSDTARLDPAQVLGLGVESGGATSHSAILARALGIPAVVGLNGALAGLAEGQLVALDGSAGQLWPAPDADQLRRLEQRRAAWHTERQRAKTAAQQPAVTQDGHKIEVVANIGGPRDAATALEFGAEGIGLFRTEFLFMDRAAAPDELEQAAIYRQAAESMGRRPLIIRTLDIGGDKPVSYLAQGREANPFLGQRGIRFCLARPDLFKPQLRAILRASAGHTLKIMFPMVGTPAELRAARQMLAAAQAELAAAGIPFDPGLEVGVMIEVPSAVIIADQLAAEVDFFSIGSNDLTQYVLAADRGNPTVADLANALQPAVLRLIDQTVQAAHRAGIWAGLCGELAGHPEATPILVGLGLDELSLSAPAIPAVKAAIRGLTRAQAGHIARHALTLDSAEAVQAYLSSCH